MNATLMFVIDDFCDEHVSSKEDGNADDVLDASTFRKWADGCLVVEAVKTAVPDNATLRKLIEASSYPELAVEVPACFPGVPGAATGCVPGVSPGPPPHGEPRAKDHQSQIEMWHHRRDLLRKSGGHHPE